MNRILKRIESGLEIFEFSVFFPAILILFSLSPFFQCRFSQTIDNPENGYTLVVDYGDSRDLYFLEYDQVTNGRLIEILEAFSLRNEPSLRFITTNQTVQVFDVMGIRNNTQKEWRLYLEGKEITPELLKKDQIVPMGSKVELLYLEARGIPFGSQRSP
jgi:hypothetical protein